MMKHISELKEVTTYTGGPYSIRGINIYKNLHEIAKKTIQQLLVKAKHPSHINYTCSIALSGINANLVKDIIDELCNVRGISGVVEVDKLEECINCCSKLQAKVVGPLLLKKLEIDNYDIQLKILCVIESLCKERRKDYLQYFKENKGKLTELIIKGSELVAKKAGYITVLIEKGNVVLEEEKKQKEQQHSEPLSSEDIEALFSDFVPKNDRNKYHEDNIDLFEFSKPSLKKEYSKTTIPPTTTIQIKNTNADYLGIIDDFIPIITPPTPPIQKSVTHSESFHERQINKLNKEIENLKKELSETKKVNEILKKVVNKSKIENEEMKNKYEEMKKENEEMKKEIMKLKKNNNRKSVKEVDINECKSGKTFYSKTYNCAVEIMNVVNDNKIQIRLPSNENDLVEISDLCYIKLK